MESHILCVLALLMGAKVFGYENVVSDTNFFMPTFISRSKTPIVPPIFGYQEPPLDLMDINPVDPVASLEGRIFSRLDTVMTPIKIYFNENNSKFRLWDSSIELIMPEDMKKKITAEIYKIQPSSDRELKNFWGKIMGELLARELFEIKADMIALDSALDIENNKGTQSYEFKELENKKLDRYSEFSGTTKLILDSLGLGVSNRDMEMYTDVVRPFLDALVAFKSLRQNMIENI